METNNKLIAEFIGYIKYSELHQDLYCEETCELGEFENLKSDSWEWLMKAVDKIENLGYEFFIVEDRVRIAHNTDHSTKTIIDFTLGGSKLDATYKGVVDFIKLHKNQL